jgi:hypothetical protein
LQTHLNNLYENTYIYKNTEFLNDVNEECRKFLSEFSVNLLSAFEDSIHYNNIESLFNNFMSSVHLSYKDKDIDFIKDYHKNATIENSDRFSTSVVNKYYGQIAKNILDYDPWFDTSIENVISCIEKGIIKFIPYKDSNGLFQNKFNNCICLVKYDGTEKNMTGINIHSKSLIIDFVIDSMLNSKTTHSKAYLFSLMRKKYLVLYNPKLVYSDDENNSNIFINYLKFSKEYILSGVYLKEYISSSLQNKNLNQKRFASNIFKIELFRDYLHYRVMTIKELESTSKEDMKIELEKLQSYNNMKDLYTW